MKTAVPGAADDLPVKLDAPSQAAALKADGGNKLAAYDGREEGLEMRGVWIATVANLNFPSKPDLSPTQLKSELDAIVDTCKSAGMNTVFFQVRPCADALYRSSYFPVSRYLSTTGELPGGFDPLEYIISKAHTEGMALVAWINPYRITYTSASSKEKAIEGLDKSHAAKAHPEWTVFYDGKLYFDPAIPEVRDYVSAAASEIAALYSVDGIHMDDYFYPYPATGTVSGKTVTLEFDDAASYKKYAENGVSLADFRRENVNKLVKQIYSSIKAIKPGVCFGISPFGIWANSSHNPDGSATSGLESYYDIYCDPTAWITGGYIDYICPQIYWAFGTSAAPFDTLVRWWSALCDGAVTLGGKPIKLYIGHAAYRVDEFSLGKDEIVQQITYARTWMGYRGSVFYGYDQIKKNTLGIRDALASVYSSLRYISDPVSDGTGVRLDKPANGLKTSYTSLYALGSSDPAYPVYYAGKKLARTQSGFFSFFVPLEIGENKITLSSNGKDYTSVVTRKQTSGGGAETLSGFVVSGVYPYSEFMGRPGDKIDLLLTAPAGSVVRATLAGKTVTLSPSIKPAMTSTYMKEQYAGSITLPEASGDSIKSLGKIEFTVLFKGETKKAYSADVSVIPKGCTLYAEVKNDYSFLKISPASSFYDDYLCASEKMRDYVVGLDRGYYKLRFGGYISKNDVTLVENGKLLTNKLTGTYLQKVGDVLRLRIGVTEYVPVDVTVSGTVVTVKLYNTPPEYIQDASLISNPLFNSVTFKADKNTSVATYTCTLKNAENYYGFLLKYENGAVNLDFALPKKFDENAALPLAGKTIIVDAGHGGSDAGAAGFIGGENAVGEAVMNLRVALELRKKLESLGAKVIMTRTDDTYYSLEYRMDFLNKTLPDLCISVHHNSIEDNQNPARVRGLVGLYCSQTGLLVTKCVSKAVADELKIYERTPSYQKLAMCRNYKFPQTLIELGFMCSAYEYEIMQSEDYGARCADAISGGVISFFKAQSAYSDK